MGSSVLGAEHGPTWPCTAGEWSGNDHTAKKSGSIFRVCGLFSQGKAVRTDIGKEVKAIVKREGINAYAKGRKSNKHKGCSKHKGYSRRAKLSIKKSPIKRTVNHWKEFIVGKQVGEHQLRCEAVPAGAQG